MLLKTIQESIHLGEADATALPEIKLLIQQAGLPQDDIANPFIKFLAAYNQDGKIIGCIGLEQYGAHALLRSLAVQKEYRSKKIGSALVEELIALSKSQHVNQLHLLTNTAEIFFTERGFQTKERSTAPDAIKKTTEFSAICPASAVYMVKAIA